MSVKQFSKDYRTFGEWRKALPRDTRYAKEIIRKHERYPRLSLTELRHLRLKDRDLSTAAWDVLSASEKRERTLSLEVLRSMRKGERLAPMFRKLGVKHDLIVRHLGKNLYKSRGYWRVTGSDTLQAEMRFYDRERGHISIITNNSRDRKRIGRYFAAVKKALHKGDRSALKRFKDMKITDADGIEHEFETDLERLYEIEEAQEEPEFLEIYQHARG